MNAAPPQQPQITAMNPAGIEQQVGAGNLVPLNALPMAA